MSIRSQMRTFSCALSIALVACLAADAQDWTFPVGTDFTATYPPGFYGDRHFDLSLAPDGYWDDPDPAGVGVFDSTLRLVVYKLDELIFPAPPPGDPAVYTFTNHRTNCPVVFLVDGDFELPANVVLSLDGDNSANWISAVVDNQPGLPGPGGFRGGHSGVAGIVQAGSGLGVGGGDNVGPGTTSAGWGGEAWYIPMSCIPLIGGSGGVSWSTNGSESNASGAGGGGAILIAVRGQATIDGTISARGGAGLSIGGGDYGGSGGGGAIRIAANSIVGSTGSIDVRGGTAYPGDPGRVRVELPEWTTAFPSSGITIHVNGSIVEPTLDSAGALKLWPEPMDPTIRIRSIAGQDLDGQTVTGSFMIPDVVVTGPPMLTVVIETTGIDSSAIVMLRATPKQNPAAFVSGVYVSPPASYAGQVAGFTQWTVDLPGFPDGYTAYQAYAQVNP